MCWQCDNPNSTIEDYLNELRRMMRDHDGWQVQFVEQDRKPFAYTVGLHGPTTVAGCRGKPVGARANVGSPYSECAAPCPDAATKGGTTKGQHRPTSTRQFGPIRNAIGAIWRSNSERGTDKVDMRCRLGWRTS